MSQLSVVSWVKIGYPLVNKQFAIENGTFIVDLPIKDGDFPVRHVSLPEGTHPYTPLEMDHKKSTAMNTIWAPPRWSKLNQPPVSSCFSVFLPHLQMSSLGTCTKSLRHP